MYYELTAPVREMLEVFAALRPEQQAELLAAAKERARVNELEQTVAQLLRGQDDER